MNLEKQEKYIKECAELTQKFIDNTPDNLKQNYSDGYHTFSELYQFRMIYNAALFNEWGKQYDALQFIDFSKSSEEQPPVRYKYNVHKSWKHYNGELCFGGGWFIVVAILPTGQISNHYEAIHWDLFKIPETEKALFPWDGHSSQDVLERLKNL